MGGVDICDQLIEYYRIWIKTRKWTLKVTLHLLDLATVNAWLTYMDDWRPNGVKHLTLLEFRMTLGEALTHPPKSSRRLLQECVTENTTPYRPAKIPCADKRLDGYDHWPTVDELSSPRYCRLKGCSGRTRTRCEKCGVYLCLSKDKAYFKVFHTSK